MGPMSNRRSNRDHEIRDDSTSRWLDRLFGDARAKVGLKDVVIGCERREDCVNIQQKLGGDLTSGPTLGLSLVVG
jgi:hypothetical protein